MRRAVLALCIVALAAQPAAAQTATPLPDYDPYSDAWNGLSTMKGLIENPLRLLSA